MTLTRSNWRSILTTLVVLIAAIYADLPGRDADVAREATPVAQPGASGHDDDPIALVSRTGQDSRDSLRELRTKRASSPILLTAPIRSLPVVVGHTTTQDESAPLPGAQLAFIVSPSRDPPTRG